MVRLQLNTKLTLAAPKITEAELTEIQKLANQGMAPGDESQSVVSKGATALLMESNQSARDELISTYTKQSLLKKRSSRVTTDKLI